MDQLKEVFPDADELVLSLVLEECNGDPQRAIDNILNGGMVSNGEAGNRQDTDKSDELLALELARSFEREERERERERERDRERDRERERAAPPSARTTATSTRRGDGEDYTVALEELDSNTVSELVTGVKGFVIPIMLKQLSDMKVPTINEQLEAGKLGSISISIGEIKVADANVPQENIQINVNKTVIDIFVKDIAAKLQQFHWTYEKHDFPKVKDTGNADAYIKETQIAVTMTLGIDKDTGQPTMNVTKCDVVIGKLDVKISGTFASFIYNTLLAVFKKTIKAALEQSLSDLITKSVNDDPTINIF